MLKAKNQNPRLARATCAALLAASFAVGSPLDASSIESIQRYCNSSWRQAGIPQTEWEDCTQDTLLELLSRLPQRDLRQAIEQSSSPERRELMRSIWCVSQRWRRQVQRAPVSLDLLSQRPDSDSSSVEARLADIEMFQQALRQLSERQRRILTLWSEGHTVAEIADILELPAPRISDQKYKAMQALKTGFAKEQGSA